MKYLWPKLWNTAIPEQNAITSIPAHSESNLLQYLFYFMSCYYISSKITTARTLLRNYRTL